MLICNLILGQEKIYRLVSKKENAHMNYGAFKKLHDYLVLKVYPKSELIVNGFKYTKEWAEPPAIFELHKVSQTRHKLTEEFEINSHKMKLAEQEYTIERLKELKDNGILILN